MFNKKAIYDLEDSKEYSEYLELVKKDYKNLDNVPEELKTGRMYVVAGSQCKEGLDMVPDNEKDEMFFEHVALHNSRSLEYLPEENKTYKVCENAIENIICCNKQYSDLMGYVPEEVEEDILDFMHDDWHIPDTFGLTFDGKRHWLDLYNTNYTDNSYTSLILTEDIRDSLVDELSKIKF